MRDGVGNDHERAALAAFEDHFKYSLCFKIRRAVTLGAKRRET